MKCLCILYGFEKKKLFDFCNKILLHHQISHRKPQNAFSLHFRCKSMFNSKHFERLITFLLNGLSSIFSFESSNPPILCCRPPSCQNAVKPLLSPIDALTFLHHKTSLRPRKCYKMVLNNVFVHIFPIFSEIIVFTYDLYHYSR